MMRVLFAFAMLFAAGAAQAEPLDLKPRTSPVPRLNLRLHPATDPADVKLVAMRSQGLAQTSVDQKIGGGTSSFGFLCGLNPGQNLGGVYAARGYDPQGKFVGAKLALPF
jgi:hypothetical protein